jgi:outer membrane protein assembly factor BamB
MKFWRCLCLFLCVLGGLAVQSPLNAQTDCGIVDTLNMPVDPTTFTLVQDFGVPSYRHQGRFHLGEDWYGGRDTSVGQPVRAVATGRVTFASASAWGSDGGVVIIEHQFPDESIAYTMYGHIAPTASMPFPDRLTCVTAGQIIGTIADVRPAPHLHFEVRVNNPDIPGPGYLREDPINGGWRKASKFIQNWQLWLQPAHEWHFFTGEGDARSERGLTSSPLILNDNSLLFLDATGTILRRATQDGRVLWRVQVDLAVSLSGYQGKSYIAFADGRMAEITDIERGRLGETWRVDAQFAAAPILAFDWLIFPTPDNALVAIAEDRRTILWRLDNIPPFTRWHIAGDRVNFVIGLITTEHELIAISGSGALIDRKQLSEMASLGSDVDGTLLVYSHGGLWRVDVTGEWALVNENLPNGGQHSSLVTTSGGRRFLFDGKTLYAYDANNLLLWETAIGDFSGTTELALYDTLLLLTSTDGQIIAVSDGGRVCNRVQVYGIPDSQQWRTLGNDGTLRLNIADQMLGMNWARFVQACGG